VQSTIDGDWIGWDKEIEMADDIRKYIVPIKFFTLGSKED
jgi:hypothetical protein